MHVRIAKQYNSTSTLSLISEQERQVSLGSNASRQPALKRCKLSCWNPQTSCCKQGWFRACTVHPTRGSPIPNYLWPWASLPEPGSPRTVADAWKAAPGGISTPAHAARGKSLHFPPFIHPRPQMGPSTALRQTLQCQPPPFLLTS